MKLLTLVIPFLNEGEEVETTIKEIRRTAGNHVDIILVNDASDDEVDYKSLSAKYNTLYIEHPVRRGSGPAKQAGIEACQTPNFLVIDAHMRFYENNWWNEINAAIEDDCRAIYCLRCQSWDYETKVEKEKVAGYAAYLRFLLPEVKKYLELKWIPTNILKNEDDIVDVPCVLGACYASSKEYWNYLKGFEGLKLYSCEEAYISLKAWMEGGRCRLLKNIRIGHLFRKKFPYKVEPTEYYYNKLFIAETLLPSNIRRQILHAMKAVNYVEYQKARQIFDANRREIEDLKDYFTKTFKGGYERFDKINSRITESINSRKQSGT